MKRPDLPPPEKDTSIRRVGQDAVTYGVGVVLRRMVSVLLLPVYTRLLTPEDYGLLELLQLSLDVVAIAVSAGTTAGVLRFYYKRETEDSRRELMATSFFLLGSLNALGGIILALLAGIIHTHFLNGQGEPWFLYLVAGSFILVPATEIPTILMQARREPRKFIAANLSILVLQLSLNIIFVVWLRMGVLGVLLSSLSAALLGGAALSIWMFRRVGFHVSLDTVRDLRRFGVPYQLAAAGGFILAFGDRVFLQASHGLTDVGIYSLAYKFGFLLITLGSRPFQRAWAPQRYELARAPKERRDQMYDQGFRLLNLFLIPVAVTLATASRPLLRVMSDPAFHSAADLIPLIVLAYVLQAWTPVVRFGIDVSERTIFHTYSVWTSAVVILGAYSIFIPRFGVWGAAVATFIGFLTRFSLTFRFAQRLWPVRLGWRPQLTVLGTGTVLTAGFHLVPGPLPIAVDILAALGAIVSTLMVAWFVLLRPGEREKGIVVAKSIMARVSHRVTVLHRRGRRSGGQTYGKTGR